ncbi:MAG: hypothetical protein ACFFA4_06325 [Promethearchaeota archaeon]
MPPRQIVENWITMTPQIFDATLILPETILSWLIILLFPTIIFIVLVFRKKINRVKTKT